MDYDAGIEAMTLAILQQTSYSQQVQSAELGSLSLLMTQANTVADGQLLAAYSDYLEDALTANTNLTAVVQSDLLNDTAVSSLLPVSTLPDTACCLTSKSCQCCREKGGTHFRLISQPNGWLHTMTCAFGFVLLPT